MIKIEKNIPLPAARTEARYPWRSLQVGDSFFVPRASKPPTSIHRARKDTRFSFSARKVAGGVRIWRTA